MTQHAALLERMSTHAARRPYQPFGACRTAWSTRQRECLLAGPADTGKSRLWIEKLHFVANKYPRARICMTRKTRKSLTQSAVVTYEHRVLPDGALGKGPGQINWRSDAQEYRYPNGSIIALSGLDDPEKLKSSEWDMIYFQEATEGTEGDWEMLMRGLRNGAMPYQQLCGDCNPSYPFHWLKRRCDRGTTLLLEALHKDNPSVTPERLAVLQAMTGVRYLRLYKGLWVAAEGIVFDEWSPSTHIVSRERLRDWGVLYTDYSLNRQVIRRVLGGCDWGFSNAGVLAVYGIDGDGRMILLEEVYRTGRLINWWIEQAQRLQQRWGVLDWYADPSRPDYIAQFNQVGLPTQGANNAIKLGIDFMKERLHVPADGRPRFMVYEYANTDRDVALEEEHKPNSITGEMELYVWPEAKEGKPLREEPVDEFNHALDVARYVTLALDAGGEAADDLREQFENYRGY
jgi:hypothetical protein